MDTHSTSSSSFQQQNPIAEDLTNFYRSKTKSFNSSGIPLGSTAQFSTIQTNRQREKRELSNLNDRFAAYIERVRYLEANNKKLQLEIDSLRGKWDTKTNQLKEKYDTEIRQARHVIDSTAKDRAQINLRVKHAEEERSNLKDKYDYLLAGKDSDREKIEILEKQLLDNEADLHLFHRRLLDLEDEQKRYNHKSENLILDIQRLTKELDNEILTRIQLANQKQTLEDEIHFLKEIHSKEIEELKEISSMDTTLDSQKFFQNQLSNAIQNIRQEYEQLNQQQRHELQSWYQFKVTQAIREIQTYRNNEKSKKLQQEEEEMKNLKKSITDSQEDIRTIRRRNEELENRIRELEKRIEIERNKNVQSSEERDRKIKDLRYRLEVLGRDYDGLILTKSSLDSEIAIYRKLLEGEEKRKGLKQIVDNIEEKQTRTYSRSYQIRNDNLGLGNHYPIPVSYQFSPSYRTESTIFEQIYGRDRQRPASTSLNVQWLPISTHSNTNRWTINDTDNRISKIGTYFDYDAKRVQPQTKNVTPPSSDYTDAYLNAFAPKPISTKRIYRINAPVFANVTPIRTDLSTNSSIKTSQTRFNNIQALNSLNRLTPAFPNSSSIASSSLIPDIFPKYEPQSTTQSFVSKSQRYKSNDSATTDNRQSPETPIHISPDRSESSDEKLHIANPPNSLHSSRSPSKISTYKPSVSFQSPPLSFTNNNRQSSPDEQTVLRTSTPEKPIERPETLLFQHDEDIRSSSIEKPSPLPTPLLESPTNRVESKIEPESTSTDELTAAASKPIKIMEQTMKKYDTIIDQISEILNSVSPLSSTVSSMSPGKSALDYELTSDGSPILQRKQLESQPSTTPIRSTTKQLIKGKYLIRDDSYDKIITAIADLDTELTPEPETPKPITTTTVIEEEKEEEEARASSVENHQTSLSPEKQTDQMETTSLVADKTEETENTSQNKPSLVRYQRRTSSTSSSLDDSYRLHDTKTEISYDNEPLSVIHPGETKQEDGEIVESNDEIESNKNNEKHVTWRDAIVTNEDESSLSLSFTEDSLSAPPMRNTQEERPPVAEEPIIPPNPIEQTFTNNQMDSLTSTDFIQAPSNVRRLRRESPSSHEISSSFSDSVDRESSPSDANGRQSSFDEQLISSRASPELINNRHISNDIYHDELGDRTQSVENPSAVGTENSKESLLASLRQTIATPATPLIEAIQSIVSTRRTLSANEPSKDETDKQMVLSTSTTEPISETFSSAENMKDSGILEQALSHESLVQKLDNRSVNDIERTQSTHNVIFGNAPLIQTSTIEEPIQTSVSFDTLHAESTNEPMSSSLNLIPQTNTASSSNASSSETLTSSTIHETTSETVISEPISHDSKQVSPSADVKNNHVVTSLSTEENQSLIEQDSLAQNEQTNVEQVISSDILTPDEENDLLLETVDELIDDIIENALSQLAESSMITIPETPSSDSVFILPINSETSMKIENENLPLKPSTDDRELSPTNTEPDSLELIRALRGHSIRPLDSTEPIVNPADKSPSTTTSSQVTSSDRYVSYAIHQMKDSSQERLPSLPIAADLPIYKTIEEQDDNLLKPNIVVQRLISKEDDSTELDATENLTSNSDDILLQRLNETTRNRQKNFDASSTDDDVDDEIEQHDLTDLEQIIDKLAQPDEHLNPNEEPYHRYELATTPSSNDSSSSARPQIDDIYFIPGYAGLWRPSADNENVINSSNDYDADDERKPGIKTRTLVRPLNSTKRPLIFDPSQNETTDVTHPENLTTSILRRPDSIDLSNLPMNEYPYDISESDSYQTCPSSASKPAKQTSSDENIYLIRENERGVSLPIIMKIDCDDIAFRLSTSSPINTQLYARIPSDLSSPSAHSEPPIALKTNSNSQESSLSSSIHDNEQPKQPSWLNTVNTITTKTDNTNGSSASRITFSRSAKGPIMISECHPQGHFITIENTSRSKTIDLSNWKIQQENDQGENLIYTFPDDCQLEPNHLLKIFTQIHQSEENPHDLLASSISSWYTTPNILTKLINLDGKDCATLTKKTLFS